MSNNITDKDYLYLSTMLRARRSNMLNQERLEQMLSCGSADAAAKVLEESGWPEMSGMSTPEINAVLSDRREKILAEIESIIPEKAVTDVFRTKYDYHNAKAIVKGEGANVGVDGMLSAAGRVTRDKLAEAFRTNDFRFLPGPLGKSMAEAKSVLARTGNPQMADFIFDRAYFEELTELADSVQDPFLKEYVTLLIDCANLRTCVRCVRMDKNADFLRSALIPGGTVGEDRILQNVFAGEGIAALYAPTALRSAAALGAEAVKGGTMTAFERECDDTVNRFLRNAHLAGFGSPCVIGYIAAEENSITAVRTVLTGLKAGIDPRQLKERLRETYV